MFLHVVFSRPQNWSRLKTLFQKALLQKSRLLAKPYSRIQKDYRPPLYYFGINFCKVNLGDKINYITGIVFELINFCNCFCKVDLFSAATCHNRALGSRFAPSHYLVKVSWNLLTDSSSYSCRPGAWNLTRAAAHPKSYFSLSNFCNLNAKGWFLLSTGRKKT